METDTADTSHSYPGARRPDRQRWVSQHGLRLAVWEWGDEASPPVLLAHGGFDFAGTFDLLAPLLADAGWRVVCWDQRGHGSSDHAVLYNWDADIRDALAVLDSTTRDPIPFIGHSKGGSVLMQLADAVPHRCTHLVNLDGMPTRRNWPDVPDHERTRLHAAEVKAWLDHRAAAATKERRPDTIEGLAARRQKMNPRLPIKWLEYLVPIGGTLVDPEKRLYRWKVDPVMRFGGFGPWRPEWSMMRMPGLSQPVLGILASQNEPMGWGTLVEDVEPWLPPQGTVTALDDAGHFVHVEQPEKVARLALDFLGDPPAAGAGWAPVNAGSVAPPTVPGTPASESVTFLTHNQVRLALHELRGGDGPTLLHLHGLAERSPEKVPAWLEEWPGAIFALDLTGHGASTVPTGGGYTAEQLMADVDTAVRHLGPVTLFGRGLGAYVALLASGALPADIRGAILFDGPGIMGAGVGPGSSTVVSIEPTALAPPDPFALAELTRDVRPADYALTFARMVMEGSPLEYPLVVAGVNRPDWLAAVLAEPRVLERSLSEALTLYGSGLAADV